MALAMKLGSVATASLAAVITALLAGLYFGAERVATRPTVSSVVTTDAVAQLFASRQDDAQGQAQPFSRWQGKTLVVNFWATWCPPCRQEMPAFSRLQDRYAAHGVQFVGIALDSADSVQAFAERSPVSYPLLVGGPEGVVLAQALGNSSLSLPYTLVLSPQREPRLVRMGPVSEGELERILAMARAP